MTVYALAQLRMKDRDAYARYVGDFMRVLKEHRGRLLAADDKPDVIEGSWDGDRVVLLSFENRATFETWLTSDEYQRIVPDRRLGADATILLFEGVS